MFIKKCAISYTNILNCALLVIVGLNIIYETEYTSILSTHSRLRVVFTTGSKIIIMT